jgi:ABC-type Fe3+/spermidine/putrescine transport system ATPase subunit
MNWLGDVGVRPEAVRVSQNAPGNGARCRAGTVVQSSFLGNCLRLEARLENGDPLVAELSRLNGTFAPGDRVHLWWQPADELRLQ